MPVPWTILHVNHWTIFLRPLNHVSLEPVSQNCANPEPRFRWNNETSFLEWGSVTSVFCEPTVLPLYEPWSRLSWVTEPTSRKRGSPRKWPCIVRFETIHHHPAVGQLYGHLQNHGTVFSWTRYEIFLFTDSSLGQRSINLKLQNGKGQLPLMWRIWDLFYSSYKTSATDLCLCKGGSDSKLWSSSKFKKWTWRWSVARL